MPTGGYNQGDFAVILPDRSAQNQALANQLYERSERRRLEQERQQKEQLQRQDTLTKYVGSEFDDKDFMTGTAADPLINNQLSQTRQKYAQMISKNPDISLADLSFQMQKDLNNINGYSANIKNARAAIMAQTKEFDKTKGIDGQAIQKLALNNFLYNIDPKTGQKTLKSASELDPNQDYVGDVIQKHPEIYLNESQAMDEARKTATPYEITHPFKTTYAGRTVDKSLEAKMYPWQQIRRDANAGVILDSGGNAQVELRTEPAQLDGKSLGFNIMAPDVYNHWVSDPARNAILIKDLNKYNKDNGTNFQNGTPEGELLKSHLLIDRLDMKAIPAPHIKTNDIISEASFRQKMEAGYTPASAAAATAREFLNAQKNQQKLEDTKLGIWGQALGGNGLEGVPTVDEKGKTYYDITDKMGGLVVGRKGASLIHADQVIVDPATGHSIIRYPNPEDAGKQITKEIPIDKWRGSAKNIASYNGINSTNADKIVGQHVNQTGVYVGKKNTQAIVDAQAQKDIANFQKKKQLTNTLSTFETGGNIADAQKLIDTELKTGTIKNIAERGGLKQLVGMDPYYIEVEKDGKIKKITFPTKDALAQYIKDNIK